jgi:hypothetical protein
MKIEQKGLERADYGDELLKRLSRDLTSRYGRGFAKSNLYQMRSFYMGYQNIFQSVTVLLSWAPVATYPIPG